MSNDDHVNHDSIGPYLASGVVFFFFFWLRALGGVKDVIAGLWRVGRCHGSAVNVPSR